MTLESPLDTVYACPRSRRALRRRADALEADGGGEAYPIRAGIPRFLRFAPAEDASTDATLQRLNETARASGWRAALDAVYGKGSGFVRYVTDPARTAFLDLLPLHRDAAVLEIGPGLGQITTALAPRVASVDALEIVAAQAEFAAERCRQEGLGNVRFAVGGDDCRLPYPDGVFDDVVLNLVIEWCAQRCSDEAFVEVQRRLLAETARVLKPAGTLYVATKNRYAIHYVIGKTDEHFHDLRFGNALPRWLGRLVLRSNGHTRPLGVLHSHNTLRRMLREAGFAKTESFWAAPEMRNPTRYVATDAASVRAARASPGFVQGFSRSTRLLTPLIPAAWVRHFTPGLAFLATTPPRG